MRAWAWAFGLGLLAGCVDPAADPTSSSSVVTITRPDDYSYLEGANDSVAHLHDYWGDRSVLPLIDADYQGILGLAGEQVPVADWQPPGDRVVPQGARWVNFTVTLSPEATDMFHDPELWVRTAADREPRFVADVRSGTATSMETTNAANDLPHQRLSAWYVQVRIRPPEDGRPARFNGMLHLTAEAARGLPIEPFPGHPDRWKDAAGHDRDQITLFDEANEVFFATQDDNVCCLNHSHPPQDGAVVPHGYAYVQVDLTWEANAQNRLGIVYHAADTRTFRSVSPALDEPGHRVYKIQGADPDGPYALQTLWDFGMVVEDEPQVYSGSYQLLVTVHRGP